MAEERSGMAPSEHRRTDSHAAVARWKKNEECSAFVEIFYEEKKFGELTMDAQSLEEDSLHPGCSMENVLYTEVQTHPSHSDTEVCWPAQSPKFCQQGGDRNTTETQRLDRNTNCLVYGESHQPPPRICVEPPPSQPCPCQQNARNSSQPNYGGSTKKNSPQSGSRNQQAEPGGGGASPLSGEAGAASINTRSVSGAGRQHVCPQSELKTFTPCTTAGRNCPSGNLAPSPQQQQQQQQQQQRPCPSRPPPAAPPFTPFPVIFSGAQRVPGVVGGWPLCAQVLPHTHYMKPNPCCWQNWPGLAHTPPLHHPCPPPVGCYPPHCSAMPAAWQPRVECGAVPRACPCPQTQAAVPGQGRPTAVHQMGTAGVPWGSGQTVPAGNRKEPVSGPETNPVVVVPTTDAAAADILSALLWSRNSLQVQQQQQEESGGRHWSVDVQLDSCSTSHTLSVCDSWHREEDHGVSEDAVQQQAVSIACGKERHEQKTRVSPQPTNRVELKKSGSKPAVQDEAVRKLCDKSILSACISVDCLPQILLKQNGAKEHKPNTNRKENTTTRADTPDKRRCCCVAKPNPKQQQPTKKQPTPQNSIPPVGQDDIIKAGTLTLSSHSTHSSQARAPINVLVNLQLESRFDSAEAINQIKQHLSQALSGVTVCPRQ